VTTLRIKNMGRRRHPRFNLNPPPEGIMRNWRDVLLEGPVGNDMVVTCREAAIVGDILTVEAGASTKSRAVVRVAESRPVMIDGSLWHRVRLVRVSDPEPVSELPRAIRQSDQ
jgi:hypothetical protein